MPDEFVAHLGGREALIAAVREAMLTTADRGIAVGRITLEPPVASTSAGARMFAVVPTRTFFRVRDLEAEKRSYLFAVSGDAGTTWKFLEGSGLALTTVRELYPELPSGFSVPQVEPVVLRAPPAESCPRTCSGRAPRELEPAAQVQAARARYCYNLALAKDPTLHGAMRALVRLSASGKACEVGALASDVPPGMADCVLVSLARGDIRRRSEAASRSPSRCRSGRRRARRVPVASSSDFWLASTTSP
jgi:hypothetical protein